MPLSGFHSNGYSLIRHSLTTQKLELAHTYQELSKSLGEELMTTTEIYTLSLHAPLPIFQGPSFARITRF